MIPFKNTDERVWQAARKLRAEQKDDRDYVAVMDRETYVDWVVNNRNLWDSPAETILGLPIRTDPSLRRGEIVLRHEVAA